MLVKAINWAKRQQKVQLPRTGNPLADLADQLDDLWPVNGEDRLAFHLDTEGRKMFMARHFPYGHSNRYFADWFKGVREFILNLNEHELLEILEVALEQGVAKIDISIELFKPTTIWINPWQAIGAIMDISKICSPDYLRMSVYLTYLRVCDPDKHAPGEFISKGFDPTVVNRIPPSNRIGFRFSILGDIVARHIKAGVTPDDETRLMVNSLLNAADHAELEQNVVFPRTAMKALNNLESLQTLWQQ